jgi:hypothetical protein
VFDGDRVSVWDDGKVLEMEVAEECDDPQGHRLKH